MTLWSVLTHKVLPQLFLPLGFALLLLLWGAAARRRAPLFAAFAVLWAAGTPITANLLLSFFEGRYPAVQVEDVPAADAIVVLGGMYSRKPGAERGDWGASVDRFEFGLDLYRAEKAPILMLSAAATPSDGGPSEGETLHRFAVARGLPPDCVVVTPPAASTHAEARVVRELLDRYGWERTLLVTSAFHMPRAMMLFEREGIEAVPVPTDYMSGDCLADRNTLLRCLVPDAGALYATQTALREVMGYGFYLFRG